MIKLSAHLLCFCYTILVFLFARNNFCFITMRASSTTLAKCFHITPVRIARLNWFVLLGFCYNFVCSHFFISFFCLFVLSTYFACGTFKFFLPYTSPITCILPGFSKALYLMSNTSLIRIDDIYHLSHPTYRSWLETFYLSCLRQFKSILLKCFTCIRYQFLVVGQLLDETYDTFNTIHCGWSCRLTQQSFCNLVGILCD